MLTILSRKLVPCDHRIWAKKAILKGSGMLKIDNREQNAVQTRKQALKMMDLK